MSDDFLSFLVDETLKLQKSGDKKLSTFELKLTDYGLEFLRGEFIPQLQVLRFISKLGKIDVPISWSLFSPESARQDYKILDSHNDYESFYAVIKAAWNPKMEKLLIIHADGFCYLVGLKVGEESYLHDLLHSDDLLKSA
jgi:hypothetical protein